MNFKFIPLFLFVFILSFGGLNAQDNYHRSIGVRGGPLTGVSYKEFIGVPHAIEGVAGFNFTNGRLVSLTGLYQYHIMVNYELNIYGGGGLTLAFNKNRFRVPLEAMVGIEYSIPWFPINVAFDYKPTFRPFQGKLFLNEFGVCVRYRY